MLTRLIFCFGFIFICVTRVAAAAAPDGAVGSITIDGTEIKLTSAALSAIGAEDPLNPAKTDTLIIISDKPLGEISPNDDFEIREAGENGALTLLSLRIDGGKLVNVLVNHKGVVADTVVPGKWFQFSAASHASGTLKLNKHTIGGHMFSAVFKFSATLSDL